MGFLYDLVHNPIFVAPAMGWLVAQFLKVIIYLIMNGNFRADRVCGSGGMPSSHSATVCALATAAGAVYGAAGFEFPMALFFAIVVMYDAMGVRRETGKQAVLLNEMMDLGSMGDIFKNREKLKELVGHTPLQVLVGAILGVVIGLVTCMIL